ncbi:MAG TPA: DAK2 domain-containing protein [Conexibacter sp.]
MTTIASLDAARARAWADDFLAALDAERLALGELDRQAGDGDYGSNLQTAIARTRAALADADGDAEAGEPTAAAPFAALSSGFMQTGGTSGPLFGMWFRAFAKAAERGPLDLRALAVAAHDGLASVQRLGSAQVGDKTMVDAMAPAVAALEAAAAAAGDATTAASDQGAPPASDATLARALAATARAARAGAEATTELRARRGRASYVGDVARGVIDPGAVTVALLFESFHTTSEII